MKELIKKLDLYNSSFLGKNYSTILNYLLILYAFSTPFMKQFNRPVAVTALIFWILEGKFKYKLKLILKNPVTISLLIFISYYYISVLWSSAPLNQTISYVNRYAAYIAIFVIYTSAKEKYLKYILEAFIFGMLISEIITYGIYFHLWNTTYNIKHPLPSPTAFMGHTAYSLFLALVLLILINKIIYERDKIRIFYIVFFITAFINLAISGGRQGVISFLIGLYVYFLFNMKNKIKAIFISSILFLSLFLLAYKTIPFFKARINAAYNNIVQVIKHHNYNSSWGKRIALNMIGLQVIKESPLIGVGIYDNIKEKVRLAKLPENKEYRILSKWAPNAHYHNTYMEIATQLGLIGLFLFLLIFYNLAKLKIQDPEYRNYKIIFIVIILTGIISNLAIRHRAAMAIFALMIGLILAKYRIEQEKKQNNNF